MRRATIVLLGLVLGAALVFSTRLSAQTVGWTTYSSLPPLSVSTDTGLALVSYATSGTHTTNSITATGAGGAGGYTYRWTYVSGSRAPSAVASTSATTPWSATGPGSASYSATWQVTVTDSLGTTASTTVDVEFESTV